MALGHSALSSNVAIGAAALFVCVAACLSFVPDRAAETSGFQRWHLRGTLTPERPRLIPTVPAPVHEVARRPQARAG